MSTFFTLHRSLQWRHNDRDGVSNHRRLYSLLNRLFRRTSKKTSRLRTTGLCEGNPPVTDDGFPSQRASNLEMVPIDDVIMYHQCREMIENADIILCFNIKTVKAGRSLRVQCYQYWKCLSCFPLALHICVRELGQHWFRYSAPSHYLNLGMLTFCQLEPQEQISVKFESKYMLFYSWKYIGKCRPRNGGHFV